MIKIGQNTVNMISSLPRQSPFRQQLIKPITQGLTSSVAASALHLTRQTIHAARRCNSHSHDILTTKYPTHVQRARKLQEKQDAIRWLKDNLYVKSGSATEVYTQHDLNYQVYEKYKKDTEAGLTSTYTTPTNAPD